MLKVSDLSVHYGSIHALKNINFHVKENELVCLIGSNGSGKSTTLMAISGLINKTSGNIIFENEDISNEKAHNIVKKGISQSPEGRMIYPRLSVEDNLNIGSVSVKNIGASELKEEKEKIFNLFPRLKERRRQLGGTLSGGEQQMLAIARALMSKPKLLMLDEPSLGLAPIIVEEIFVLLQDIKKLGMTILLIEQNAAMALSIADRGYVLELGEVILENTGENLLQDEMVKRAYLGI